MSKLINLEGKIIKGWIVLNKAEPKIGNNNRWVCQCTCDTDTPSIRTFQGGKIRCENIRRCSCTKPIENGCEVCGDMIHNVAYRKSIHMTLCSKHYNQIKKYGEPSDSISRTIYDDNEIIIYDTYAEILLFNKNSIEVGRAIIDLEDVDRCKQYKWHLIQSNTYGEGYAIATIDEKYSLLLHKFITNSTVDIVTDHINCNKLDCRKENLREADKSKNSQNREPSANNTSGFTGVYFNSARDRWYAYITHSRKHVSLGSSKDKKEAILLRLDAEREYFGEFRNDHNANEFIRIYGSQTT